MQNVKEMKPAEQQKEAETLYEALFNVQQGCPSITKETTNPFFKSKYADLPTIWAVIRPLMKTNKLFLSHSVKLLADGEYLLTKITHVPSGEEIETSNKITLVKQTAQDYGSYMTYMRRYALTALLGLVTDEDDDGNSATESAKAPVIKPAAKPAAPSNPLQEVASRISKQLHEAESADVLTYIWEGFTVSGDLPDIKKASPDKAYAALENLYNKRLATLRGGQNE